MNAHDLSLVLSGAVLLGYVVVALLFWRFWRQTHERLFAWFAAAFFIMAVERGMLVSAASTWTHQPHIYVTRLVAYLIIIWAIWDKNRPTQR